MPPKMEIDGEVSKLADKKPEAPTSAPAGPRIVARMPEDFRDREERRAPRGKWIDELGRIRTGRPPGSVDVWEQ